jgi:hypothetical protein
MQNGINNINRGNRERRVGEADQASHQDRSGNSYSSLGRGGGGMTQTICRSQRWRQRRDRTEKNRQRQEAETPRKAEQPGHLYAEDWPQHSATAAKRELAAKA